MTDKEIKELVVDFRKCIEYCLTTKEGGSISDGLFAISRSIDDLAASVNNLDIELKLNREKLL